MLDKLKYAHIIKYNSIITNEDILYESFKDASKIQLGGDFKKSSESIGNAIVSIRKTNKWNNYIMLII